MPSKMYLCINYHLFNFKINLFASLIRDAEEPHKSLECCKDGRLENSLFSQGLNSSLGYSCTKAINSNSFCLASCFGNPAAGP